MAEEPQQADRTAGTSASPDGELYPHPFRKRWARRLAAFGIIIGYAIIATLVLLFVRQSGTYPDGADTMFYVYRGDLMYRSIIEQGNWFPLLDMQWYNGVESFRYWSPLSAYILAGCQALAGGDPYSGYLVFVWLLVFSSACVWLRIGYTHGRPWMGAVLGALWFFMPNNLFMLFTEGVLVRSIIVVVLPLFLVYVYDYLKTARWTLLPRMIICFVFIIMCHTGWAGMIAIALCIFMVCYAIANRAKTRTGSILIVFVTIALAFMITGLWLVPSLIGGITSTDSSEIMAGYFQSLNMTLNPFFSWFEGYGRWVYGDGAAYFGLVAFILAVFGIFFSGKRIAPGFATGAVICLLTSNLFYPLLDLLPGGQYLWMLRFISIALCFVMVSFFFWDRLRPVLQAAIVFLLIIDAAPALSLITVYGSGTAPHTRYDTIANSTLIDVGKSVTEQRMLLVEPKGTAIDGVYVIAGYGEDAVPTSGGQGIQAATIASDLVQINQAAEDGNYLYMFDRALELGNDTVLIPIREMHEGSKDRSKIDGAAKEVGYTLVENNGGYRLYHYEGLPIPFGLVSSYRAIGIGISTHVIALQFPAVEETTDPDLNAYTFEELSKYDIVFLDHFTYTDREAAEDLLIRLSEAGTRVVITADGVPADERTAQRTFLGFDCETINFRNGYPALHTLDGSFYCDLFPAGYGDWKTTYVNGLDRVWGTVDEDGRTLDFYGTVKNDNIVVIGLNLAFFYSLTQDSEVGRLLERAYDLSFNELPEREIVPLDISYAPDSIAITSEYDHVDTTIAYHDMFSSEQDIWEESHLLYVNKGTTIVKLCYPYFWQGLALTIAGLISSIAFVMGMRGNARRDGKREKEKQ